MFARSILAVFVVLAVASTSTSPAGASARFPATKRSSQGGSGRARIAFYVCRNVEDFGKFATAQSADASCAKLARARCPSCRVDVHQAAAAYGPYRYPARRSKDDWFSNSDYPYETLDGRQYSEDGYVPTP